jgi:lauroyl/myristoyl acyltransferase
MDAYIAFRALGAVAPRIPPGLGYVVASGLADLGYRRNVKAVRGLRANIRRAMGASALPETVDRAVRQAYRALLQNYFDLFRLPALTIEQLRSLVHGVGWENIGAARALGRGMVLLSAHLGNPEAGLQIVGTTDLPAMAPAEHIRPERLYRYLTDLRTRHGLQLIPSDGLLRELFRALRQGGAVGLALDRDTTDSGVEVTLCGAPARVPDGYAHITAKMRVPLVPAFCFREPGGQARLEIDPAFVPDDTADREEAYCTALEFGVRALEGAITAHPEQWVLTTPLWIADTDTTKSET